MERGRAASIPNMRTIEKLTSREHEYTLNVRLGEELRKRGLTVEVGRIRSGRLRIDVAVRIGPVVVAVETEHGQSGEKRAEAVWDADTRLEERLAQCAVALCYPDGSEAESLPDDWFHWAVRDKAGGAPSWTEGNLDQLESVIRLAPAQLRNPDYMAASLSVSLDRAVGRLTQWQKQQLARTLDLPPSKTKSRTGGSAWDKAAKRSLLVVATAVLFHSRLDASLEGMKREEYDSRVSDSDALSGEWPPTMAHICATSDDPVGAFQDAWTSILALDYKPIFQTALAALRACPPDPAFTEAVRDTARVASIVAGNLAGLRHDLLGRIFHTVLDTARYDGSFYTTTAGATMLAALAIREDMCDWSDADAISKLRIIDPACGTGTLLMAAAERIRELAPHFRKDESVASALIEQALCGYDVNVTALHMAATTLGLLSPTTRFRNMKIGRAFLGVDDDGQAFLGSLEFLDQQPKLIDWPDGGQTFSQVDSGEETGGPDPADLVIMNPPFTRSGLRHDQFSEEDEQKLKDREKQLFSKKPVHLSSNGNAFLVLADYITKANSCTIAAVLPLVTATNASSLKIRKYLASRYHIETIVTSHDPDRIYFSENTSIGEMLIVCRRRADWSERKPPTRVVNLATNPGTPAMALSVAWAIEDGNLEKIGFGTVQEWPEPRMRDGNWGAVQFISPYLCEKFDSLRDGRLFETVALNTIAVIGPDGVGTRSMFNRSSLPRVGGMTALWDHKTDVTQSMAAETDTHITPRPGKEKQAMNRWKRRGRLLLPMRARLNTVRALGVLLEEPALGSAWTPCKPRVRGIGTETLEKALCVYLNSSVGVLGLLGDRSNKAPSYPRFSMDDLKKMPVPDFAAIGRPAAAQLAEAYDALAGDALLPLPSMAECKTRRSLDRAVAEALGLEVGAVSIIRRSLVEEPSLTGRPYGTQLRS